MAFHLKALLAAAAIAAHGHHHHHHHRHHRPAAIATAPAPGPQLETAPAEPGEPELVIEGTLCEFTSPPGLTPAEAKAWERWALEAPCPGEAPPAEEQL